MVPRLLGGWDLHDAGYGWRAYRSAGHEDETNQ